MIFRTLLSVIISVIVLSQNLPQTLAQQFRDIQGHWAARQINELASAGVISGYRNQTFRPNSPLTRAEFAAIIVRALRLGNTVVPYTPHFKDVPIDYWAYRPIEISTITKITTGYPNNRFRPTKKITRTEAFVMIAKAAKLPLPSSTETERILSRYYDSYKIQDWARPYVASVIAAGLINPTQGGIQPQRVITRAETAAVIYNLRNYLKISATNR